MTGCVNSRARELGSVCFSEKRSKRCAKARGAAEPLGQPVSKVDWGLACTVRQSPFQLPSKSKIPLASYSFLGFSGGDGQRVAPEDQGQEQEQET